MTDEPGVISWWRYVPHRRVDVYEAAGWKVEATAPSHHDRFATLMRYAGKVEGQPPEPGRRLKVRPDPRFATGHSARWRR